MVACAVPRRSWRAPFSSFRRCAIALWASVLVALSSLSSADFGVPLFHQPIALGHQTVQFPDAGDVGFDGRVCGAEKFLEGALFLVQSLHDRVALVRVRGDLLLVADDLRGPLLQEFLSAGDHQFQLADAGGISVGGAVCGLEQVLEVRLFVIQAPGNSIVLVVVGGDLVLECLNFGVALRDELDLPAVQALKLRDPGAAIGDLLGMSDDLAFELRHLGTQHVDRHALFLDVLHKRRNVDALIEELTRGILGLGLQLVDLRLVFLDLGLKDGDLDALGIRPQASGRRVRPSPSSSQLLYRRDGARPNLSAADLTASSCSVS